MPSVKSRLDVRNKERGAGSCGRGNVAEGVTSATLAAARLLRCWTGVSVYDAETCVCVDDRCMCCSFGFYQ
mgnify:CR=1 FL=1